MKHTLLRFLLQRPRLFRAVTLLFRVVPNDRVRLLLVRRFCLGQWAGHCLQHYLSGTRTPLSMETADLLAEDDGVRQTLGHGIAAQQARGLREGRMPVPQYAFANMDWRCALGSVNIHWKQAGANLVVAFEESYRWDPTAARITRVFHQAAEKMKQYGAGEFQMRGAPAVISLQQLCGTDAGLHVPIDRLYM